MDIASIIGILLFILPGIMAQKVSRVMEFPSERKHGDFYELVYSIALSFPILFCVLGLVYITYGLKTLQEYVDKLNEVVFLIIFIIITLMVSVVFGVISAPIKKKIRKVINDRRNKKGIMSIDDKTCWEKTFLTEYVSKFLRVFQDGKIIAEGFAKHYALPNEEKSLTLYIPEELTNYKDFNTDELFTEVLKSYINLEKNIVIKDYDMKKFNLWCEKKETESIYSGVETEF